MIVRRNSFKVHISEALVALAIVVFFCEYLVYYVVLLQCKWPTLDTKNVDLGIPPPVAEEKPVYAMFLADTHLLGSKKGHWFDKLKREWQMHRAFQTAMSLHKPELVFFLGDIFDEGLWCSSAEFEKYVDRFESLFSTPPKTHRYVVAGNHDIGFHYAITPYLNRRFVNDMKSPNVRRITVRGNHFVLINSMAFEGDGCFLCRPAELAINKVAKQLRCSKDLEDDCTESNSIKRYSRPILLQHYPMYRESDEKCHELDEAPSDIKTDKFRERWECLSKVASNQLLDTLTPRLIVDGHTHHGCTTKHREDILEVTIPSFSWRNKDNPSFLLGVFTPDNFAISKCYMPVESTIIKIYILAVISFIAYSIFRSRKRSRSPRL